MSHPVEFKLPGQDREGGAFGKFFCSAPHPTSGEDWCRRQPHDDGPHSAFTHSIKTPEEW